MSVIDADQSHARRSQSFIVYGRSFVTSRYGAPTMAIQALAFRAAERITRLAKAGSI